MVYYLRIKDENLNKIDDVKATKGAFAALNKAESIVGWGHNKMGGVYKPVGEQGQETSDDKFYLNTEENALLNYITTEPMFDGRWIVTHDYLGMPCDLDSVTYETTIDDKFKRQGLF